MASIKFVSKKPAGTPGNFRYTYECKCNSQQVKTVTVDCANDNEAKVLAQQECESQCGETE